ncbi:MAG: hypothetical protein AAGN35_22930 [Bacteroidota bacterium]
MAGNSSRITPPGSANTVRATTMNTIETKLMPTVTTGSRLPPR